MTVSLCMIVRNEEETLARCLTSAAAVADEIIIADTGSTDRTKEIAAQFTDKIYDFTWVDDFSAARNFAFSKATGDFLLWLDADDVLLPADAARFRALKERIPHDVNLVMMRYNTGFDALGNVTFSYYRERLARRSAGGIWREPVHEYLDVPGRRMNSDVCVTHQKPPGSHQSDRNLQIYESRLAAGETLSARGTYYYARELRDHGRYKDAIVRYRRFLDEGNGWVEDNITACCDLAGCWRAEGHEREALAALFESFRYDAPRAEVCCQLGYHFKARGQFKQAVYWFGAALAPEQNADGWGFRQEDCYGFIPCIELAVCYDQLGQTAQAAAYNERAATYRPDAPAVSYNRRYFGEKQGAATP